MSVPAGVGIMVLLVLAGGVADVVRINSQKLSLQRLADDASLAAAQELILAGRSEAEIVSVAESFVLAAREGRDADIAVAVNFEAGEVSVDLTAPTRALFPGPMQRVATIEAASVAQAVGEAGNVCVIALSPDADRAISIRQRADMEAAECAIYSNSSARRSMSVLTSTNLHANFICVAGGFDGPLESTTYPEPMTDCPPISDPLASRAKPAFGACDYNALAVRTDTVLSPGVYCGGLTITGGARVIAQPGIYTLVDGDLTVTGSASLTGEGVGFHLVGASSLQLLLQSTIDLAAPETGDMAGLLVFAPAAGDGPRREARTRHSIRSDNARRLVGTIYLPDGQLVVDGNRPLAADSEYTVIVAHSFELFNGPSLVLNTGYELSNVPVPEGLGPVSNMDVRLKR